MSVAFEDIRHDGGTHRVEVEIEGDQCVIRFGASFTLRVNEANLNTLREMIHDAERDMTTQRQAEVAQYTQTCDAMDDLTEKQNPVASRGEKLCGNDPVEW